MAISFRRSDKASSVVAVSMPTSNQPGDWLTVPAGTAPLSPPWELIEQNEHGSLWQYAPERKKTARPG